MTLIEQALSTATDTREFRVGHGILPETADVFKTHFPGKRAKIVADETTWRVAGERVLSILRAAGVDCAEPLIFPARPQPYADTDFLARTRAAIEAEGPDGRAVAVGAGTLNDLCKRASTELERPYMCVATAASVDGYASYGAPITKEGFKKTWPCAAPLAIVADSEILLTAPRELTASGYADLAAKVPSGADWIIADALEEVPIRPDIWATTQTPLRDWVADPAGLAAGDAKAMGKLFTGLAMTGFAMQTMHDSRPASGAEHLFSHCWEMHHILRPDGTAPSHGDKVGIGSLCTTHMMESFFAKPFTAADIDAAVAAYPSWEKREAFIRTQFEPGLMLDEVLAASKAKHRTPEALRAKLNLLVSKWDDLAARVKEQLYPFAELRARLAAAGCPVTPEGIGVKAADVHVTALRAQIIRNRYTILDLAQDTGRLDALARELDTIW
ncbi:MAG: sn-glycerol-1-phosphate dehydrogenase [Kiritimatiellae bacterium]|nr:sn-glycerol-1-phosphate dehydrogenase [Kiritimatiellia bacterium]